mmetsp:Transcript_15035/g.30733  ORF Transcript_15035/g.30733 Transcript_15035/m.30733 type:complete len:118 (-) Transcript_15035:282-635(-)
MYIAKYLGTLIAATLDGASENSSCRWETDQLIGCMIMAGLPESQSKECILCLLDGTENSRATTCEDFEAEGICENSEQCAEDICTDACMDEFRTWQECKLGEVGCGDICQDGVVEIA